MKTSHLMAGASRFAHFAGLSRKSSRAAAEDDQTDDDGKGAEEDDDGKDAEDEDDGPGETKGKKGRKAKRAEDDDSDEGDEPKSKGKKSKRAVDDDDDDDDEEPKAKGKKSRRAAEDDDDGDDEEAEDDDDKQEMTGRSAAASARRRERARCAAIFAHKSAANNVPLAMSLAFDTTMTRQEAIAVMRGQAKRSTGASASARSSREARNADLGASDEPGGNKPKAGATWGRSFTKLGVAPRA